MLKRLKLVPNSFPFIFVFLASLFYPGDPDLGWHLKYGQYFWQHHQILRDNTFSSMMANYHWANGSWGTDALTYGLFHLGGFLGLTIAGALIVTLTFFFFAKASKLSLLGQAIFFPIFVFFESTVNGLSFRGQQLSLLMLGILFFLLSRVKQPFSKTLFLIPPLFLLWCNLQEESFLGLALFGVWIFLECLKLLIKHKRFSQEIGFLGLILGLTILSTLINPFGIGIHLVALTHFHDPLLKLISEYVPFPTFSILWWSQILVVLSIIGAVSYLFFKKTLIKNLSILVIPLLLISVSFAVKRYAWPAYYLTLPVIAILWQSVEQHLKKISLSLAIVLSLLSIFLVTKTKLPFSQFIATDWEKYCSIQLIPCLPDSAKYLSDHNLTQNVFSLYDWGGWLIWNYPSVKPSIDGRMHLWRDTQGYSAAADYQDYLNGVKSIDNSPYDVVYLPLDGSIYGELSDLISQGRWKIVYDNEAAGIFVRTQKN